MKKAHLFFLFMIFTIVFSSCSSSTMIQSEPTNAKVFINGSFSGNTPFLMTDTKIMMSNTQVHIEKEGYLPLDTYIIKDEQVDVGAAIGGVFFFFPWLWLFGYAPQHNYILKPTNNDEQFYYNDDVQHNDIQNVQDQDQKSSKAQKLIDLKKLYDDGILNAEEYEKEKKKILDQENW